MKYARAKWLFLVFKDQSPQVRSFRECVRVFAFFNAPVRYQKNWRAGYLFVQPEHSSVIRFCLANAIVHGRILCRSRLADIALEFPSFGTEAFARALLDLGGLPAHLLVPSWLLKARDER